MCDYCFLGADSSTHTFPLTAWATNIFLNGQTSFLVLTERKKKQHPLEF